MTIRKLLFLVVLAYAGLLGTFTVGVQAIYARLIASGVRQMDAVPASVALAILGLVLVGLIMWTLWHIARRVTRTFGSRRRFVSL